MTLEELLDRAQKAHKQNQQKSREIYDMMKKKLIDKNTVIAGLTDQVTQLKVMLDNAAEIFSGKTPADPDNDRTAAYLVDTDSTVEDARPAPAQTEALESGEKIVDMTTNLTKEVETVSKSKTVVSGQQNFKVVDIEEIKKAMTELMWQYLDVLGSKGLTEYPEVRAEIVRCAEKKTSDSAVYNAHNGMLASGLITAEKIKTGSRWFLGVELTQLGSQIYVEKHGKPPVESEMRALIREHDNLKHGYTIKDASRILRDTKKYKSVSTHRRANTISLDGGKRCIPDIVCCGDGVIDYYEVDCGNHRQSEFNDKCNKLKSITKNLYVIAPSRDIMLDKLKPQIEKWIASCGGPFALAKSNITVYLTSIYDLANGKWALIYNMESEEPLCLVQFRRKGKPPVRERSNRCWIFFFGILSSLTGTVSSKSFTSCGGTYGWWLVCFRSDIFSWQSSSAPKTTKSKMRDRFSDMNTNIAAEAKEKTPRPLHLFFISKEDAYAEAALCAKKRGRAGLFQSADN